MQLDDRQLNGRDGVAQGDTGVRVGGGIQRDGMHSPLGLLNPGDQLPLVIGLAELHRYSEGLGAHLNRGFDTGQGVPAVNLRLAGSEQIQVGTIEEEDLHHAWVIG